MPKRPDNPQNDTRRVLDSIRRIVKVLRVASRDSEKRVGISGAQLFVLHKLAEGGVLSVNELAERTHTHQSSVSVVVHRLAERGMVDLERSAADARQAQIRVTAAGKSVIRSAPAAAQDRLIAALKHLARKDVRVGSWPTRWNCCSGKSALMAQPPPRCSSRTNHLDPVDQPNANDIAFCHASLITLHDLYGNP